MTSHSFLTTLTETRPDWRVVESGVRCYIWDKETTSIRDWVISFSELAAVHPDLPVVLRACCSHHMAQRILQNLRTDVPLNGWLLAAQIKHVLQPEPILDRSGKQQWFVDPIALFADPNTGDVTLVATTYTLFSGALSSTANDVASLPLVNNTDTSCIDVSRTFLDAHYPSWFERLAVSNGLGLNNDEAARYALGTGASTRAVNLPDLDLG